MNCDICKTPVYGGHTRHVECIDNQGHTAEVKCPCCGHTESVTAAKASEWLCCPKCLTMIEPLYPNTERSHPPRVG